jgi:hypothetical protein
MICRVFAILICFAAGVAFSNVARAVTIQPNEAASKDTFVYQFLPTFNFNSGGFGSLLTAGATGIGHDTESLVQFDLSSVGLASAQVTSASFQLYVDSTSAAGFGLNPDAAHPIQIDLLAIGGASPTWDENTVTWSTEPTTVGGLVASATINGINQWITFDVTSLVKQWLDGTLTNNGFLLRQDAVVPGSGSFYVGVFDSSAGTNQPLLNVVPEPTSMVLALCALPWIAWGGKRAAMRRGDNQR